MKKEIITNKVSEHFATEGYEVITMPGNKRGFEVVAFKGNQVLVMNVFSEKVLHGKSMERTINQPGTKLAHIVCSSLDKLKVNQRKELSYGIALADTEQNKTLLHHDMVFLNQHGVTAYLVGDVVRDINKLICFEKRNDLLKQSLHG